MWRPGWSITGSVIGFGIAGVVDEQPTATPPRSPRTINLLK
jgi:hypothetical protein